MDSTPKLISDVPSTADRLGGVHERVAIAIARLIRTCEGGKTIRLDGTWGSGKSTVVRLLADDLEGRKANAQPNNASSEQFAVFQYDTWVHTGDPLRRAFMTALIGRLESAGWLPANGAEKDVKYWKTQLQRLDRRLKITSKKTEAVFSPTAKVVVAALLGIAVVSPSLGDLIKQFTSKLGVGVAILLALAVAAGVFLVLHALADKIFAAIVQRLPDEVTTQSREDPDPTTLEFQSVFGELMGAVLGDANQTTQARNLVLIVDNLDRIGDAETREVWSLLRSFLDNPAFSAMPWFGRLWVLVPIADAAQAIPDTTNATPDEQTSPERGRSTFMEKVFQVRFSLPDPMLHSWKGFLARTLRDAFSDIEAEQIDVISRLFEEFEERNATRARKSAEPSESAMTGITPRGIVSFVNDLVALKIEHGANAGLPVLAGYVLTRANGASGRKPPEWMSAHLGVDRLDDRFAMLYYHAKDVDEASYILIKPMLVSAILSADAERLRALLEQSPGAPFVLDRFIRREFTSEAMSSETILLKARALAPVMFDGMAGASATAGKPRPETIVAAKQAFFEELSRLDAFNLHNEHLIAGLKALVALLDENEAFNDTLLGVLARSMTRSSAELDARKSIHGGWTRWSANVREAFAFVKAPSSPMPAGISIGLLYDIRDRLEIELRNTAEGWVMSACQEVKSEIDPDFGRWFSDYFSRKMPDSNDAATLRFALDTYPPDTGMAVVKDVCENVQLGATIGIKLQDDNPSEQAMNLLYVLIKEVRADPRTIDRYWSELLDGLLGVVASGATAYFLWMSAQPDGAKKLSAMLAVLASTALLVESKDFTAEPPRSVSELRIHRAHELLLHHEVKHVTLRSVAADPTPMATLQTAILSGAEPLDDNATMYCAALVIDLDLFELFAVMTKAWGDTSLVYRIVNALPRLASFDATLAKLAQTHPERSGADTFRELYLPTSGLRQAFALGMQGQTAAPKATLAASTDLNS